MHYGDDFLAFVPGAQRANLRVVLQQRKRVQHTLASLGLTRAEEKGQWEPTTSIDSHLGLSVSTTKNGGEYNIPFLKRRRIR